MKRLQAKVYILLAGLIILACHTEISSQFNYKKLVWSDEFNGNGLPVS